LLHVRAEKMGKDHTDPSTRDGLLRANDFVRLLMVPDEALRRRCG